MCRNIKTLFNFKPPASQYVRKISGFAKPSEANGSQQGLPPGGKKDGILIQKGRRRIVS